jgi:cbb3-type cytochrome oxidase subunit 1
MTRISDRFLQLGVLAALIGMTMGALMGAKQDFTLAPAHAHLNLLGWASMMIYGLFYRALPDAGRGWLATAQFWLAVTGLVVLIPSLALELLGNHQAMAGIAVGSLLTLLSMAFFAAIVVGATRKKTAAMRAAA